MGDNIPNTEPSTTVNPVYDEIKNSAPYEDSLNKQWIYNKEPALTATPDTPPYKPTSTIIDETFADMPGYTEMKNSFDRDRFNSEVEKSLENRQQYSSGTGIFRKLYDDGKTTPLDTPFTEPTANKYKPTTEQSVNKPAGLVVTAGNLQVDFSKIDRIIEILKEIKDGKIPSAKSYVGDQVMLINNVPDFTSAVGRLDSTDINQPLTNLAAKIEKLINDYEYVKGEVKKYNSNSTGALAGSFTTLIGRNNSSSSESPVENVWRPSSTTTTTTKSTEAPTEVKTPQTTPQTEVKTTPTTERPTVPVTTEPTTTIPQTTEPVKHGGPLPSIPVNRNTTGNGTSGGGYYWNGSGNGTNNTVTTEAPTVATEATFDIKEGNKYKLPTSSRPTTTTTQPTTTSKGNSVIPVLAGLSAAAAAGIGAKAYMDRKKNNDNESEEEFKSEDWSDNNDINIEYQEPVKQEAETLEFDDVNNNYEVETPEKYGAKTHQELEDLQ